MVETHDATRKTADAGAAPAPLGRGLVMQVNVSPGGVPKHPVPGTRVGRLGLEGDVQAHPGIHGGPHRAVCLLAIEVIRRVAAEGHPIVPGSVGENRRPRVERSARARHPARLEGGLEPEISAPANPCDTSGAASATEVGADLDPGLRATRAYGRADRGQRDAGEHFVVLPPADTNAGNHSYSSASRSTRSASGGDVAA
jgi:hypothetical protein